MPMTKLPPVQKRDKQNLNMQEINIITTWYINQSISIWWISEALLEHIYKCSNLDSLAVVV